MSDSCRALNASFAQYRYGETAGAPDKALDVFSLAENGIVRPSAALADAVLPALEACASGESAPKAAAERINGLPSTYLKA